MEFLVLMYGWARSSRSSKLTLRRIRPNDNADAAICGDATAANPNATALVQVQLGEIISKIM